MGSADVGVVAIKEWSSGDFGAYIFLMNGGYYLDMINS